MATNILFGSATRVESETTRDEIETFTSSLPSFHLSEFFEARGQDDKRSILLKTYGTYIPNLVNLAKIYIFCDEYRYPYPQRQTTPGSRKVQEELE